MDIGKVESWIQLAVWLLAGTGWLIKWKAGGSKVHPTLKKILESNRALGVLIILGIAFSMYSLWIQMGWPLGQRTLTLNISEGPSSGTANLKMVEGETFSDQQVPLDGYFYKNDTFTNVCVMYNGGYFGMENVKLVHNWKVCSMSDSVRSLVELMSAMDEFKSGHGIIPPVNVRFTPQ